MSGEDAGTDAGAAPDAGALPGCTEDNADASVAARDGFFEACLDPVAVPRAQCGDGSPLEPWLFEALSGEGAYGAGSASAGGDFSASTDACLLPGALEW